MDLLSPIFSLLMIFFSFVEAFIQQMDCVLDVVDKFCGASGHQINKGKTNIFFSKNISSQLKRV